MIIFILIALLLSQAILISPLLEQQVCIDPVATDAARAAALVRSGRREARLSLAWLCGVQTATRLLPGHREIHLQTGDQSFAPELSQPLVFVPHGFQSPVCFHTAHVPWTDLKATALLLLAALVSCAVWNWGTSHERVAPRLYSLYCYHMSCVQQHQAIDRFKPGKTGICYFAQHTLLIH